MKCVECGHPKTEFVVISNNTEFERCMKCRALMVPTKLKKDEYEVDENGNRR
jgi:hypothetical protein